MYHMFLCQGIIKCLKLQLYVLLGRNFKNVRGAGKLVSKVRFVAPFGLLVIYINLVSHAQFLNYARSIVVTNYLID